MVVNRLVFAALGLACVTAAGGAYVATRQNPSPASNAAEAAVTAVPVQATEEVLEAPDPAFASPEPAALKPVPRPPAPSAAGRSPAPRASSRPVPPSPRATEIVASAPASDRSSPSTTSVSAVPPAPSATVESPAVNTASDTSNLAGRPEESRSVEPVRTPPEPPAPALRDLTVSADSVIGLQMETAITSERARVEDRVEARVVRDVRVGGDVAIPAGSRAVGSVMVVERGGRMKDRARLGIRFHTLVLADGTQVPITSETIYRNGEAPGNASATKIGGGAVAGAILGAIIGGAKGAAIGGSAGAGAGTAAVMAGDRSAATFPAGAEVTARIVTPVTVTVQK